jgi:hypothetical protein
MSDSTARTRSIVTYRHGPRQLVRILQLLGLIRRHARPDVAEVDRAVEWFCNEVHLSIGGVRVADLVAASRRLAERGRLDEPEDHYGAYFGGARLDYILEPLHKLDLDGTTAKLWGRLWFTREVIRKYCNELFPDEDEDANHATGGPDVSQPVPVPANPGSGAASADATLTEASSPATKPSHGDRRQLRRSKSESEVLVRDYLEAHKDRASKGEVSIREVANETGVPLASAQQTAAWRALQDKLVTKGLSKRPQRRRAQAFTGKMDSVAFDAELQDLIRQQEADDEGSPLGPDRRRGPRIRKKF